MWRYQWNERIVVPFRESDEHHHRNRREHKQFQRGGYPAHRLNAADVDPDDYGNQCDGDQIVFLSADLREEEAEIVGEQNRVDAAEKE